MQQRDPVQPKIKILKKSLFKKYGASLVAQSVKNLPATEETQVQFLGQEDPNEKEMATYSSILAWRIPLDRGTWQATVHGVATVRHNLATKSPHLKRETFELF